MTNTRNDWEVLEAILDIEQEMFSTVFLSIMSPNEKHKQMFRFKRWLYLSVMPPVVLRSHLEHVRRAKAQNINLVTQNFGVLEGQMPSRHNPDDVDFIVDIETEWMKESENRYASVLLGKGDGFRELMALEMEMFSRETLSLVQDYFKEAARNGENLYIHRCENLERLSAGNARSGERQC